MKTILVEMLMYRKGCFANHHSSFRPLSCASMISQALLRKCRLLCHRIDRFFHTYANHQSFEHKQRKLFIIIGWHNFSILSFSSQILEIWCCLFICLWDDVLSLNNYITRSVLSIANFFKGLILARIFRRTRKTQTYPILHVWKENQQCQW